MPWYNIRASQYGTILVNGFAYPFIDQGILEQWMPDLTYVSSFSYGFTPDGDIIPLDDERVLATAKAHGVGALMVLAPLDAEGHFSNELASHILNTPSSRDRLVNNILATIQERGLNGVDFDFEYVFAQDRDLYVTLVSEAAAKLNPAGYIVTVDLAPKTSTDQPGLLYQGHDYRALGLAANLAMLMTYEWGYTYGPPMAVAPINMVREVVTYAVTQINPSRILMGIPNYGYDWTLPYVKGQTVAENISNVEALARAERVGATIQYDEVAQSPFYNYTDSEGRQHIVWFEDARSMRAKLELVNEFKLAGIGIWTVMDPFPSGQEVLNSMFTITKVE